MGSELAQKDTSLRIYFVVGEESGDALGASLLQTFKDISVNVKPVGLAGPRMQKHGMTSQFDINDISVMGISGVVARLPKLLTRIRQTVNDIVAQNPDVLLLVDSPEFSYRVAKRVRKANPDIKIIKYVSPSVWAWRPGRAKKITPYIDQILAVLPFEPDVMKKLGGPPCTYVGHPLASDIPDIDSHSRRKTASPPNLVVLPGSRQGEISRLLPFIRETLNVLKARGNSFEIAVPSVSKLEQEIRQASADWPFEATVVTGDEARRAVFAKADLALAASGTVTLELALYKVPTVSIYKLDGFAMRIRHWLTGWTASLPNLIADYPVVPERFNEYAHPEYVARMIERLCLDDHERKAQIQGFERVIERVQQEKPSSHLAAETILKVAG